MEVRDRDCVHAYYSNVTSSFTVFKTCCILYFVHAVAADVVDNDDDDDDDESDANAVSTVTDDSMYNVARDDDALMSSCFRESLSVDCGPRHRIRVVTDWASSRSSRGDTGDAGGRSAEGSCSVDPRHCVVVASRHADIARQFCVGRRSCDGLRVTSRPCPRLHPADYQLLVFICVPGS